MPPTLPPPAPSSQRAALRIPSPPPIPRTDLSSKRDTAPGVGEAEERRAKQTGPRSLLSTQVGLGVIRLGADGAPLLPQAQASGARFLVEPGLIAGQLVLTAVTEATPIGPDSLVVALAASDVDAPRLARAILGLK